MCTNRTLRQRPGRLHRHRRTGFQPRPRTQAQASRHPHGALRQPVDLGLARGARGEDRRERRPHPVPVSDGTADLRAPRRGCAFRRPSARRCVRAGTRPGRCARRTRTSHRRAGAGPVAGQPARRNPPPGPRFPAGSDDPETRVAGVAHRRADGKRPMPRCVFGPCTATRWPERHRRQRACGDDRRRCRAPGFGNRRARGYAGQAPDGRRLQAGAPDPLHREVPRPVAHRRLFPAEHPRRQGAWFRN